jgi:2,5-diamino-6-(ribosylamino)-4(3H)-pyrimidinone 5'-phosphate reductase
MNMENSNTGCLARWAGTETIKSMFQGRFDCCRCHAAYPDQKHTFVGDCSSDDLFVAMVPDGDVSFPCNKVNGVNIVVVVSDNVSADYLEYLEDKDISYVFGGENGEDMETVLNALKNDFGVTEIVIP